MRNVLAHAGKQGRRVVAAFIGTAFAQDDAEAARVQWRQVADQLRPRAQKFAELMDEAETDVLAYMSFPPRIEPSCTRPIRSSASTARSSAAPRWSASSPTRTAVDRLIGAILLEQNDEWAVQRARYMTLETIAPIERRSSRQTARRGSLTITG